jgi:glutaredoxin 3
LTRSLLHPISNDMTKKVEIFTKFACPYCFRAKLLLEQKGVAYDEIDASGGPNRDEMLARSNGGTTVPQIFIGGYHVGGCDELVALDQAGKLDPLLTELSA